MKKNFLITTGLIDTWEFSENNFLLGKWCEFYEFNVSNKRKPMNQMPKGISIIRNVDHWNDDEKKIKDYEYIKKILKYLLEIISEKLSIIHNVTEDKEYWRVVIYGWLSQYTPAIFHRWESVRIFFEKNKISIKFINFVFFKKYSNALPSIENYSNIFIKPNRKNNSPVFFIFINIMNYR